VLGTAGASLLIRWLSSIEHHRFKRSNTLLQSKDPGRISCMPELARLVLQFQGAVSQLDLGVLNRNEVTLDLPGHGLLALLEVSGLEDDLMKGDKTRRAVTPATFGRSRIPQLQFVVSEGIVRRVIEVSTTHSLARGAADVRVNVPTLRLVQLSAM